VDCFHSTGSLDLHWLWTTVVGKLIQQVGTVIKQTPCIHVGH